MSTPVGLHHAWTLARGYRGALMLGVALMLAESAAALAVPWTAGIVANAILSAVATITLQAGLVTMLVLFAAQAALRFASSYVLDRTGDRIVADLKVKLYEHLQALPIAYYQRRKLGDVLGLLMNDVYAISGFVTSTAVAFAPLVITAGGAAVVMLTLRRDMALLALAVIPLAVLGLKVAGRRLRPLGQEVHDEEVKALAMAEENLTLMPLIKAFAREEIEASAYRAQVARIVHLYGRQRRLQLGIAPVVHFTALLIMVGGLAWIGDDLLDGSFTPAALVSFLLYAQLFTRPMSALGDVYGHAQFVRGALSRVDAALGEDLERRGGVPLPAVRGDIQFENVSFAYEGRDPVLRNVDLSIRAGEVVALVGENGSGKSTLAHLLLRLHEPHSGLIRIDGKDIAGVEVASLRSQIGMVHQHAMLLNATIRDNIAYGRAGASNHSIERAAAAAGAHAWIVELPEAYETVIGDNGVRLSGGQRQRLALARALLKDPPILVLDEATAMFDPVAEEEFLETCAQTLRGRTVLFITHRPACLRAAHRVIRLEAGRIVRNEALTPRLRVVDASD